MKYNVKITGIGDIALDFLSENMIILFNDNAPAELAEISVLHEISELTGDVAVGDQVTICDEEYVVTAVGDEALHTLKKMGHCSLKFDGADTPSLPGTIHLKGEKNPTFEVGKYITIQ
ncbi:PTS system glucitol/sorbitol-specific IIA component [Alkalibaculum bacchi]|uniref:PTS system glucitol/sorbitol-specific IIA component n=1 Tax=Alkalibaculum bacchi TaxID=645887 RepID=A0A366I9J1_9FIRM|nr:PTS glucitol/sorbitol transporter subunit IIA [Alkalibaculum bacchi]RBP65385.1 PTS system glucitol/sorbitol-specific IIA component [Alkalibaculum bacchi]